MPRFEKYEGESEEEFAERLAYNRGQAMEDRFTVEEESVRLDAPKPFYDTAPVKDPNELEAPSIEAPSMEEPTLESPELEKPATESFADFEEDEEPRELRKIDPEATKNFYERNPQILDEEGSAMDYFLGPDPKKTDYYKQQKKRNFK
tara:strand:+ start:35 stop:478 length:444 start_codon:yes stop_codon:yes gene_type:complete